MSDELRRAFEALICAVDTEIANRDARIDHLEVTVNTLKNNMSNAAGVFAAAARALQEGLNDY